MTERNIGAFGRVTETLPQGGDHIHVRDYGVQPDGDLVGSQAQGEVFSATVSLDPNEEYVTDWFDTDGYSSLAVFINSTEVSEIDGVMVDYTDNAQADSPNVLATESRSYASQDVQEGFEIFNFGTELDGIRFRYKNNGTTVSDVDIVGTLNPGLNLDSANYVNDNTVGDTYIRVGTTGAQRGLDIGEPTSLFDDLQSVERRSLIDLSSTFGTSGLRDEIFTTGSGSVTQDPAPSGEIEISTGTTADSSVTIQSQDYGRYTPGFSAQVGIGIRIPNKPTEGEIRWGYFDDSDGFYWGYDGGQEQLFVARQKNGTESERTYLPDFNGFSFKEVYDRTFDSSEGFIYQIDFSWYGYGIINFQIVGQTEDTITDNSPSQSGIVVHSIVVENDTSIDDPNEPIRVVTENGSGGEDVSVRIGGRQYSVLGDLSQEGRTTADTKNNVTVPDGSWNHIVSWRRRDDTGDANARLAFSGFDFGSDTSVKVALVANSNISNTTWENPELVNPDETLIERSFDGSFGGIGDGSKVWEGSLTVPGTGQGQESFTPDIGIKFGQDTTVSLLVQGLDGETGTGIATTRLREDW